MDVPGSRQAESKAKDVEDVKAKGDIGMRREELKRERDWWLVGDVVLCRSSCSLSLKIGNVFTVDGFGT